MAFEHGRLRNRASNIIITYDVHVLHFRRPLLACKFTIGTSGRRILRPMIGYAQLAGQYALCS